MISMLISLLIFCIVAGLLYWCVTLLPLPQPFKNIVVILFILIIVLILLGMLGGYFPMPLGRIR